MFVQHEDLAAVFLRVLKRDVCRPRSRGAQPLVANKIIRLGCMHQTPQEVEEVMLQREQPKKREKQEPKR